VDFLPIGNTEMAYYYKHPDLILPDDNTVIWRYMDFSKFQSILQRSSIFFSRADKQTDKLEGEYPIGMLDELERRWGISKSDNGKFYTFAQWHYQREIPSRLLSCWSVGIDESRKRWSTYTTSLESVAIRSTIERLKNCFRREENDSQVVWIGKIRYGDDENKLPKSFFKWKVNYFLFPFFAKKDSFRWENEVRAIVNISHKKQITLNHSPNGCFIKADPYVLIDSVWVHPQANEEFRHKVESLIIDHGYGEITLCKSHWNSVPE
jgi:hypothetical protein